MSWVSIGAVWGFLGVALGAVTPIGGLAMLAGWLLLAWHAYGLGR